MTSATRQSLWPLDAEGLCVASTQDHGATGSTLPHIRAAVCVTAFHRHPAFPLYQDRTVPLRSHDDPELADSIRRWCAAGLPETVTHVVIRTQASYALPERGMYVHVTPRRCYLWYHDPEAQFSAMPGFLEKLQRRFLAVARRYDFILASDIPRKPYRRRQRGRSIGIWTRTRDVKQLGMQIMGMEEAVRVLGVEPDDGVPIKQYPPAVRPRIGSSAEDPDSSEDYSDDDSEDDSEEYSEEYSDDGSEYSDEALTASTASRSGQSPGQSPPRGLHKHKHGQHHDVAVDNDMSELPWEECGSECTELETQAPAMPTALARTACGAIGQAGAHPQHPQRKNEPPNARYIEASPLRLHHMDLLCCARAFPPHVVGLTQELHDQLVSHGRVTRTSIMDVEVIPRLLRGQDAWYPEWRAFWPQQERQQRQDAITQRVQRHHFRCGMEPAVAQLCGLLQALGGLQRVEFALSTQCHRYLDLHIAAALLPLITQDYTLAAWNAEVRCSCGPRALRERLRTMMQALEQQAHVRVGEVALVAWLLGAPATAFWHAQIKTPVTFLHWLHHQPQIMQVVWGSGESRTGSIGNTERAKTTYAYECPF